MMNMNLDINAAIWMLIPLVTVTLGIGMISQ